MTLKGERLDAAATAIEPQGHEHVGTQLSSSLTPSAPRPPDALKSKCNRRAEP